MIAIEEEYYKYLPKYAAILYRVLLDEAVFLNKLGRKEFRWIGNLTNKTNELVPAKIPNCHLCQEAIEILLDRTDLVAWVTESGSNVIVGSRPSLEAIQKRQIFVIHPHIVKEKEEEPMPKIKERTEILMAKANNILEVILELKIEDNRIVVPKGGMYAYIENKLGKKGYDPNVVSASFDIFTEEGFFKRIRIGNAMKYYLYVDKITPSFASSQMAVEADEAIPSFDSIETLNDEQLSEEIQRYIEDLEIVYGQLLEAQDSLKVILEARSKAIKAIEDAKSFLAKINKT